MNYHRGHWKKWAALVSDVVPTVGVALDLYNTVEHAARPRMPYQRGGHPVAPAVPWVFSGPPANEWRVADVVNRVNSLLMVPPQVPGVSQRLEEIERLLRSVPPVELDMALARLGPPGLTALDDVIGNAMEADDQRWYACPVQALFNYLLESTSPYVAGLIGAYMEGCQPTTDDISSGTFVDGWVLPAGPFVVVDGAYRTDGGYRVEASEAPLAWQDVLQGAIGDCWFLTSLQAVAKANPGFLPQCIRPNLNGTISVFLHHEDDRKPCPVTVPPDLPVHNGALIGASGHTKDPAYAEMWPAYYEKAYAQMCGGYSDIEGGFARRAFPIITGRPVDHLDPRAQNVLYEVDNRMRAGQAVAVGTVGQSDSKTMLGGRLVQSHEYFVKQVDVTAGRICLGNPWGDAATKKQWECWLTYYEVPQFVDEITAVNPW